MSKIHTVKMPDIGEGVVEGEIIEWLKSVNDLVKQDEPVVVVMTDKATVELPSPYPGKIVKQYYQPGQIAIRDRPLYDLELIVETPQEEQLLPETKPEPTPEAEPVKKQKVSVSTEKKTLAAPPIR